MKKLITLLLVLVSLNSYSQNDSIVKYYREITDDLWVQDCLDNWVKDTTKQWKWKTDLYIHVTGDKNDFIMSELSIIVKELNELIDPINIYITDDTLKRNCRLFIGSHKEYYHINDYYQDAIDEGNSIPFGYSNSLGGLKSINAGLCFVNITHIQKRGVSYGWSSEYIKEEIKCTLREEVTQMLGYVNDSYTYPNSVFQESKSSPITKYSEIDKEIIKMLYN